MATEAKKLQVGGFVLTALVLALAALIWLGATRLFQRSVRMVTYFTESVQGLDPGAPVKYRGVPAGRVEDIGIAPDPALIEVVMSIDREFVPLFLEDPTLRAQLELVGITGLKYVAISRHEGDSLSRHPELTFDPPYPVIPSAPSTMMELATAFDDIYDKLMAVDFGGISDDLQMTLQTATALMQDERVDVTLTNLATATRSAGLLADDLRRLTGDMELGPTLANLEEASAGARDLVVDLREGASGDDLRQTVRSVSQLAESGQVVLMDLQLAVERLDLAIGDIEASTRGVRDQPSLLLFSEPPEPREPGRGRRR